MFNLTQTPYIYFIFLFFLFFFVKQILYAKIIQKSLAGNFCTSVSVKFPIINCVAYTAEFQLIL